MLNEDKMQIFCQEVNWAHFQDCALICQFYCYEHSHLANALSGVSGMEYSSHDILAVGARAQRFARRFNLREGFAVADDRLPRRVMQAFAAGPLENIKIAEEAFAWARRRLYELMRRDPETGVPVEDYLCELGLDHLDAIAQA